MCFGLGRRGWPKLIVRWEKQPTLETYVQITENDEPIFQRIAPLDVGVCIIDYDKLHRFFKKDECALSLWHAGVDGEQMDQTSTKVYSVVDVPLHIRLAAQKVDVEAKLRAVRAENNKRKYDDQPIGGGKDWKRSRHTPSTPPWRSRQSSDSNGAWSGDSWKGSGNDWKEHGSSWKAGGWKECDNPWQENENNRDWSWASSGKRSRRW